MENNKKTKKIASLSLIRVESEDGKDTVFLKQTGLKAFEVTCEATSFSHVWVNPEFSGMDQTTIDEVFHAFVVWKRASDDKFAKLPNHSGMMKQGKTHPWRRRANPEGQGGTGEGVDKG